MAAAGRAKIPVAGADLEALCVFFFGGWGGGGGGGGLWSRVEGLGLRVVWGGSWGVRVEGLGSSGL